MDRPTEEQIKALKPGDRVLVEAVFVRWGNVHGDDRPYLRTDGQPEGHCGAVEQAAIHSILPREIQVGDQATHWASGTPVKVLAVDAGDAWVKGPSLNGVVAVKSLRPLEVIS